MAKLLLKQNDNIIAEYDLDVLPESFTVGSAEYDDIVISDAGINRNHLRFERVNGRFTVTDPWSSFGTLYNGKQLVKTVTLYHGDSIEIGRHSIEFFDKKEEIEKAMETKSERVGAEDGHDEELMRKPYTDTALDPEKLGQDSKEIAESSAEEQSEEETVSERTVFPRQRFCLLAISGPYVGKRYFLDKDKISIGRDVLLNDIIINKSLWGMDDSSISSQHAQIDFQDGRFFISDKESTLGTKVNQQKLDKSKKVPLNSVDEIEIVSNLKSTIFRFVEYGNWDFSPPKKAGSWWDRNSRFGGIGVSLLIVTICLIISIRSCSMHSLLLHKPEPLQAQGEIWLPKDESLRLELDEAGFAYSPSLALCDLTHDDIPDVLYVNSKGHIKAVNGKDKSQIWPPLEIELHHPQSVSFADYDGDKITDILAIDANSHLLIFDGHRGKLMNTGPAIDGELVGQPVTADVNGDGNLDIAITGNDGKLHIGISDNWSQQWSSYRYYGESHISPTVEDLDGDGIAEILIGSDEGVVFLYSHQDKNFKRININEKLRRAKSEVYAEQNSIRCPIAVGSIHSGRIGVVISTLEHSVIALEIDEQDGEMKRLWFSELLGSGRQYPMYTASPVIIDLDGDHKSETILASHNGIVLAIPNEPHLSRATPKWIFNPLEDEEDAFVSKPAFADIDRDGILDVIVAGKLGRIYVIDGDNGLPLLNIMLSGLPFSSSPVIGDVDGDNRIDILAMDIGHNLYKVTTNAFVLRGSLFWSGDATVHSKQYSTKAPKYYLRQSILSILILALVLLLNAVYWWRRRKLQ